MTSIKEWLLALLFPHKCFMCGRVLVGDGWLCGRCLLTRTSPEELCSRCGKMVDECVCKRLCPEFSGVAVPLYYSDGVRAGIHRFKYNGRGYYAAFLALLMKEAVAREWPDFPFDCIVYVPMHHKKQRSRGYCPSELLARELGKHLRIPVRGDYLRHTSNTRAQVEQKNAHARLENASCSFATLEDVQLAGARVLLVDDVLTTGATVHVCASLLLAQGAGIVQVAVAATATARRKKRREIFAKRGN